jgi:hypothetical protein
MLVPVSSVPPGATISIDGKESGQTPAKLPLEPGKEVTVALKLKGFREWKWISKPKEGEALEAKLVPAEKLVEVTTTPPNAQLTVDGKVVGRTPFTVKQLDLARPHTLTLRLLGYAPISRQVTATDNFEAKGDAEVLALAVTMEKDLPPRTLPAPPPVKPALPAPPPVAVKKPDGPKPVGDKPALEKPAAEKTTEKPAAEKPAAEKPAAEKPIEKAPEKKKPAEDDDKPTL